jgi:hypothetical protein
MATCVLDDFFFFFWQYKKAQVRALFVVASVYKRLKIVAPVLKSNSNINPMSQTNLSLEWQCRFDLVDLRGVLHIQIHLFRNAQQHGVSNMPVPVSAEQRAQAAGNLVLSGLG